MNGLEKGSALLGRFLFSLIFILCGFMKIAGWTQTAGFMSAKGLPMVNVMLAGAVLVEVLGGLLMVVALGTGGLSLDARRRM